MSTQPMPAPPAPKVVVSVYRVSPRALPLMWKQAKPHLLRGLVRQHAHYTLDDIEAWVISGSHDLWVATENGRVLAAIITKIVRYNSGKRAWEVLQAGGFEARKWIHQMVREMGEFGHLHGVTEWRVVGRPGWLRWLKRYGFAREAVVLVYEEA